MRLSRTPPSAGAISVPTLTRDLCQVSAVSVESALVSRRSVLPESEPLHFDYRVRNRSMKLYVGNLSFSTTEAQLRELFSAHGEVASATLVMDRETGRPRGFGFVEFSNDEHARAAMAALSGKNIDGRDLTVNEAKPRENRGGGGGGGGGGRRGNW